MLQQLLVMMSQNVLRHAQDVQRRVGEVLKPMLTPIDCASKHTRIQETYNSWTLPQDIQTPDKLEGHEDLAVHNKALLIGLNTLNPSKMCSLHLYMF